MISTISNALSTRKNSLCERDNSCFSTPKTPHRVMGLRSRSFPKNNSQCTKPIKAALHQIFFFTKSKPLSQNARNLKYTTPLGRGFSCKIVIDNLGVNSIAQRRIQRWLRKTKQEQSTDHLLLVDSLSLAQQRDIQRHQPKRGFLNPKRKINKQAGD